MAIEGKHNLNNPIYVKAVLETALSIFNRKQVVVISSFQLANEIVSELGLPSGESTLVMNVIAPRMAISAKKEYAVFILESIKHDEEKRQKPICEPSPEKIENAPEDTKQQLKRDILKTTDQYLVVPLTFLEKTFGCRAEKLGINLNTFLDTHFALSEIVFFARIQLASKPGVECSWSSFVKRVLQENNHQPFNINILADRLGMTFDETKSKLKKRQIGSLMLWTEYDVWSIVDVTISEKAKRRLQLCFDQHGDVPILLDDLFNNIFVGLIAVNYYSEVFDEAKLLCINKAFAEMDVHDYTYEKEKKRFRKKGVKPDTSYLYKMF